VGQYRVDLPGLDTEGGTVHVSAYGGNHYAKVVNWTYFSGTSSTGGTQYVSVNCFDPRGNPVDGPFVLLFYKDSGTSGRTNAYLWANNPVAASYTPAGTYQWNSKGLINTVRRISAGHYQAVLPGMTAAGGTVLVTAYGSGTERCKVGGWSQSGSDTVVDVYCFDVNGNPIDTTYTLSFLTDVAVGQGNVAPEGYFGGYIWADQPTQASYTPATSYQLNTASSSRNTATRSSTGAYSVRFPALKSSNSSTALVTAYGVGRECCTIASWSSDGSNGTVVSVRCYDTSGNPVDTTFTLTYLTDDIRPS
jgi:hypothetical protein